MQVTPLVGSTMPLDLEWVVQEEDATDNEGWEETQEQYKDGKGEGRQVRLTGKGGGLVDHEALRPHHLHLSNLKIIKVLVKMVNETPQTMHVPSITNTRVQVMCDFKSMCNNPKSKCYDKPVMYMNTLLHTHTLSSRLWSEAYTIQYMVLYVKGEKK